MKKQSLYKIICLSMIFVSSLSSCVNHKKIIPEFSYGYDIEETTGQGLLRIAFRRSEENHKDVYEDDEDLPVIIAYGFKGENDNSKEYSDQYYLKQHKDVRKIVFYFKDNPWDGILMDGEDTPFVNSVFGEGNEQYKHLEDYGYYFYCEYDPEEFYTNDFVVTIEKKILLVFSHEEEIYLSRDLINAVGNPNSIGFVGIVFRDNTGPDGDIYPYKTAGTFRNIEFAYL